MPEPTRSPVSTAASLSRPSPLDACDICQGKQVFLFYKEDRAILFKDCNASVHGSNDLTMKHNWFILTGVRLSLSLSYSVATGTKWGIGYRPSFPIASTSNNNTGAAATSIISEYLIEMCPVWRVEDLLVDDESTAMQDCAKVAFFSNGDGKDPIFSPRRNELLPFSSPDQLACELGAVVAKFARWAPQLPPPYLPAGTEHTTSRGTQTRRQVSTNDGAKKFTVLEISNAPIQAILKGDPHKSGRPEVWASGNASRRFNYQK